jgi:ubiquinone/menaquinone biosynthesis C-methylase UbiE
VPHEKFDLSKLERLNDPARFEYLIPEVLWAAAATPDPAVVVEIGAGTGLFACELAALAPEATVYAVDMAPAMIRWMLKNRPLTECGRLRPMLSTENKIPLPTGGADLVVMINVHHELADPISSYREAQRLLAIGGTIVVADWALGDTGGGPPQHVRASAEQIAEILRSVGFEDIREHEGLPKHSLVTAKKPVACSL